MKWVQVKEIFNGRFFYILDTGDIRSAWTGDLDPNRLYTCYSTLDEGATWSRLFNGSELNYITRSGEPAEKNHLGEAFLKGAVLPEDGDESVLTVEEAKRLGGSVCINFDGHYKEAGRDELPEPILILEAVEKRLIEAGVDVSRVNNIGRGLKYILRCGLKEGEEVDKEIHKFFNYVHRARTGEWIGGE